MNASIDQRCRRLHSLQEEIRSGALNFARSNAARIAAKTENLVNAVRNADWATAALFCTALFHLIQLQMEAERLISRMANKGGRHDARRH